MRFIITVFFLSLDADTSAIAKQHELSHKQAERKSVYINDETKKNKGWRKTARKWKIDPKRFDFTKAARLFFSLSFQCVVLHLYSFWKNIELGKMSTFAVFSTVICRDEAESVLLFWKLDRQITFPLCGARMMRSSKRTMMMKNVVRCENNPSWKEMEKRLRLAKDSLTSFLKCLRRWTFPRRLQMINVYQKIIREPLLCYL